MEWNAYHFVGDTLRDGSPVPDNGVTLVYDEPIELCASGYHASRKALDALRFAPGLTLCRVNCSGIVEETQSKLVCSERTIIDRIDSTDTLQEFSRKCSLSVLDKWDAPEIVRKFLETGDEVYRSEAHIAARSAALSATVSAACDEAYNAALSATSSATLSATDNAACDAAWNAAYSAALSVTNSSNLIPDDGGACDPDWCAAWDAAWSAAWSDLTKVLEDLVTEKFVEMNK
jgi:hypothetical protein